MYLYGRNKIYYVDVMLFWSSLSFILTFPFKIIASGVASMSRGRAKSDYTCGMIWRFDSCHKHLLLGF